MLLAFTPTGLRSSRHAKLSHQRMDSHGSTSSRAVVRRLYQQHARRGDHVGWFEMLYQAGRDRDVSIPWADRVPNPHLVGWHRQTRYELSSRTCLTVGCGLGDDAEYLASAGGTVTAFDVASSAIASSCERFPRSTVDYQVRDLFNLPPVWHERFDLVVEIYTLQVLPPHLRGPALQSMVECVAPGGSLLLITRGRDEDGEEGDLPWPIAPSELALPATSNLTQVGFDDFMDEEEPPVRRFRVQYDRTD